MGLIRRFIVGGLDIGKMRRGIEPCHFCGEAIVFDPQALVWVLARGGKTVGNRYVCEKSPENKHTSR